MQDFELSLDSAAASSAAILYTAAFLRLMTLDTQEFSLRNQSSGRCSYASIKDLVMTDLPQPLQKQVFVAYAYNLYDKRDYRRIFASYEKTYGVKFIFADEKITNMHILQKIISYIKASDFSIFDISGWNANVTLELGIALAFSENWYIAFNPAKTPTDEVPSDIKGIDRIQYSSFSELEDKLAALLEQRYPKQLRQPLEDYIGTTRDEVKQLLQKQPGLKMNEIAKLLGVSVQFAQVIVLPMIGTELRVQGKRRGARYFPISQNSSGVHASFPFPAPDTARPQ